MKKEMIGVVALFAFLMMACSTGKRLERAERKGIANIRQLKKDEKAEKDTVVLPKHITYVDDSGKEQTIMSAVFDTVTGEYITSMELQEVVVVSKARSIPERNGKVSLDFIINIPDDYLKRDWRLVFTPVLDNAGDVRRLDSIVITGNEWKNINERKSFHRGRKLKQRAEWSRRLKGRVGGLFTEHYRDSVIKADEERYRIYEDSVNAESQGVKLDTVIRNNGNFEYHYSHIFPTNDMATKLVMSFDAYIENLQYDRYALARGDTLNYFISSMMQFLNRSPRYKRKIVHRRVTESLTADIQFLVGQSTVLDTLANNLSEIERIRQKMDEINNGNEFVIDSIVMTASCSPEGSVTANALLARQRAEGLRERLKNIIASNAMAEDGLRVHSQPEDWDKLTDVIRKTPQLTHRNEILKIVKEVQDLDERELKIRQDYPEDYKILLDEVYPKVRHVDFNFFLARRNMVEDVMFTDVIDTDYADAIKLMDRRKYKEAMAKLTEYDDWNAAICYMSLGYNQRAYEVFAKEPETSDREYLMSILLSRMGKTQQAVDLFLKSCRMDYSKINRGELDPEISALIEQYKLDEIVGW